MCNILDFLSRSMMTEIELSTIISLTDNEDETDIAIQV